MVETRKRSRLDSTSSVQSNDEAASARGIPPVVSSKRQRTTSQSGTAPDRVDASQAAEVNAGANTDLSQEAAAAKEKRVTFSADKNAPRFVKSKRQLEREARARGEPVTPARQAPPASESPQTPEIRPSGEAAGHVDDDDDREETPSSLAIVARSGPPVVGSRSTPVLPPADPRFAQETPSSVGVGQRALANSAPAGDAAVSLATPPAVTSTLSKRVSISTPAETVRSEAEEEVRRRQLLSQQQQALVVQRQRRRTLSTGSVTDVVPAGPPKRKQRRLVNVDPATLTMRDLVRYNPKSNPMKSTLERRERQRQQRLAERSAPGSPGAALSAPSPVSTTQRPLATPIQPPGSDRARALAEGEEGPKGTLGERAPVLAPQVKIVNGQVVINEDSLEIAVGHGEPEERAPESVVYETTSHVSYASYTNRSPSERWTAEDTRRFYLGLQQCGTDFALIEKIFPNRTRRQIKNKFKREERENRALVDAALAKRVPIDFSLFQDRSLSQISSRINSPASSAAPTPSRPTPRALNDSSRASEGNAASQDGDDDDDDLPPAQLRTAASVTYPSAGETGAPSSIGVPSLAMANRVPAVLAPSLPRAGPAVASPVSSAQPVHVAAQEPGSDVGRAGIPSVGRKGNSRQSDGT